MAEIHSDSEQDKPKNGDKEKSHTRMNPTWDAAKPFLQGLAEGRLQDSKVKAFLDICERYCRSRHFVLPIEFAPMHPVEETVRLLVACILKHHDLGHVALALVEHQGQGEGSLLHHHKHYIPKSLSEICRVVYQTRRHLMKTHQERNVQYEELCAPIVERCQFLFRELRPAIGNEVQALKRLKILNTPPRWKNAVHQMIQTSRTEAAAALGKHEAIHLHSTPHCPNPHSYPSPPTRRATTTTMIKCLSHPKTSGAMGLSLCVFGKHEEPIPNPFHPPCTAPTPNSNPYPLHPTPHPTNQPAVLWVSPFVFEIRVC
ncbi:putative E3 ubiquitin-protein ligase HERC2 [Apostichopus japonicus]|uniref:Putative E3 ubiquitin-protein ligase HERC2 n=1 Tax=Stichopus japonicus TaxID=307972 RepID=A0A2G8L208_STIJA|nr:putative E3 ubiquitin-protein ligase HERC2 [Apostichopus japonicus]